MSEKKKKRPPLTRAATEVNENTLKALNQIRHPSLYKKNHAKSSAGADFNMTSGMRRIERARSNVKDLPKPMPAIDPYMDIPGCKLSRHRSCPHLLDEDDDDDEHTPVSSDVDDFCGSYGGSTMTEHQDYQWHPIKVTAASRGDRSDTTNHTDYFSSNAKVMDSYNDWSQNECDGHREGKKQFRDPPFSAKIHSSSSLMSPTEAMFRFDRISTSVSDNFSDIEEPNSELILEDRVSDSEDQDYPLHSGREGDAKCNQWLQGLQLSQTDRLKSRSHLRLPPV
ncbi:uncharacterized protein LOC106872310 [Octopus bimaculoides]|uniref:Uncharacterized protein n=1 Tax=Octopus bimaculoides TaxID=37653 RepID=A0A0L8H7H5_OCTBM|nr:uncharacterized protein LOC106872310 [Octopus bimaculoides]|eukprot:XP_014774737.1 PREDICTED: uncharacterized protein LOC106872310 [Octopus bimaculoides]